MTRMDQERAHGWYVARRTIPLGVCAECEVAPATDRHHWDNNPANNDPRNVVPLCRFCHMRIDGRAGGWRPDRVRREWRPRSRQR